MHGRTYGWMDRWIDGRTDGWPDGYMFGRNILTLFQIQYMEGLVAIIYEKSSVFVGTVGTAVGTVVFL